MTSKTAIDPRILDDEGILQETGVSAMDLNLLESTLFPQADEANDPTGSPLMDEESDCLLLDDATTATTTAGFIDCYSRINIVDNQMFAIVWQALSRNEPSADLSLYSVTGNSRNAPTPFIYRCRKTTGCSYESVLKHNHKEHESTCSQSLMRRHEWKCPHEGCDKSYADRWGLQRHIKGTHEWVAKPCEHGCDPTTLYTTIDRYQGHISREHKESGGLWPCPCRYPGCNNDENKTYKQYNVLRGHLINAHGLTTAAQWQPYLPTQPRRLNWVARTCPMTDCRSVIVFKKRPELVKHIARVHHMSHNDAKAALAAIEETD
jgi:uncharacterized C2H2 Zn-finger protein